MTSEVTLFATQRQLGVELTCLRGTDDPFGDRATNINADFTIRHNAGFAAWLTAARKAYRGKKVRSYCTIGGLDKKPDGCIDNAHGTGDNKYLEYKMLSPLDGAGAPSNKYAAFAAHAGVSPILDEIQGKYGRHLTAGGRHHSLTRILTDTFGGVHVEGVKFLKDSGVRGSPPGS